MNQDTQICIDCGQEFEITEGFKRLVAENPSFVLPKRCYPCRQKRKAEKQKEGGGGFSRSSHKPSRDRFHQDY